MGQDTTGSQQTKTATASQPVLLPLLIILLATVVLQLAGVAYNSASNLQEFKSTLLPSILFLSLTTIPLGWIGIWLGRQIGLGTPLLAALLRNQPGATGKLAADFRVAMLLGLSLGAGLVLLRIATEQWLPPDIPAFGHRGFWGGLIISAAAAVGEEVWFRLGLMTIILWVIMRVLGHTSIRPAVAWPVIITVSFAFGLMHLPQLMSYGAGSPSAIWATVIGNSVVGTMYGWCYWRRSFIAAVIAHFAVDVVLHALPALVT
jgi:membrane protease YdiL (CAAX protease family)